MVQTIPVNISSHIFHGSDDVDIAFHYGNDSPCHEHGRCSW